MAKRKRSPEWRPDLPPILNLQDLVAVVNRREDFPDDDATIGTRTALDWVYEAFVRLAKWRQTMDSLRDYRDSDYRPVRGFAKALDSDRCRPDRGKLAVLWEQGVASPRLRRLLCVFAQYEDQLRGGKGQVSRVREWDVFWDDGHMRVGSPACTTTRQKAPKRVHVCPVCEKLFTSNRGKQHRFCSTECRQSQATDGRS